MTRPAYDLVVRSRTILADGGRFDGAIAVRDGRIAALLGPTQVAEAYQNAQGDVGNARNIAEKFLADGVDVLTPCTTPNVQAAVRVAKGGKTPVVFACVTDPVAAGNLESVTRPSGTNVTGVYNPLPIGELFDLFLPHQPGMKTAGTIYNASEGNSQVINRQAKAEAERRGLRWVEATIAGSADVRTAAESLIGKVDALILGQDNTVASAFEAVVKVAQEHQLPLFSMDTQAPARGAIASLAASNYEQGVLWAKELVAPVLLGADPATMTPVRPRVFDLQVNVQAASAAKLTIPDGHRRPGDQGPRPVASAAGRGRTRRPRRPRIGRREAQAGRKRGGSPGEPDDAPLALELVEVREDGQPGDRWSAGATSRYTRATMSATVSAPAPTAARIWRRARAGGRCSPR